MCHIYDFTISFVIFKLNNFISKLSFCSRMLKNTWLVLVPVCLVGDAPHLALMLTESMNSFLAARCTCIFSGCTLSYGDLTQSDSSFYWHYTPGSSCCKSFSLQFWSGFVLLVMMFMPTQPEFTWDNRNHKRRTARLKQHHTHIGGTKVELTASCLQRVYFSL